MEYAGFWRRAAAVLIDGVIFGVATTIIGFVVSIVGVGMFAGVEEIAAGDEAAAAALEEGVAIMGVVVLVMNLAFMAIYWLYFTIMECSSTQGTVGKMVLGIVVTDVDGDPISFGRANGRFFGKFISSLILGIGYIMVAFTEHKQGLHDMMAGCLVLRNPR